MGFLSSLLEIIGFGIGIPIGFFVGFLILMYLEPKEVKDPVVRPIEEFDSSSLLDLYPEVPFWVKNPDYDRVDWLNRFIYDLWPCLEKAICAQIRIMAKPIFAEYVGKFQINSIDFETLSLGTLPPIIHGIKVYEVNENELVFEPAVKWAGNSNITMVLRLLFLRITIQLTDVQICAEPRIILKPFVPTFPCFASIIVSLMEKPYVDFGLKVLGADVMAIPGFYQFVQEIIRKQIASLYLWPHTLEIPILDSSVGAVNKPLGILHVKVLCARNLLKKDFIGMSDPYVQLSLSGERLPAKKSSIKMNNLNPDWNEDFKLLVKDLQSQVLQLHLYDWEKFGPHDKLGMQVIPLKLLMPHEKKEFTLDLLHSMKPDDPHNKKPRGKITVEMTFNPFKQDNERFSRPLERHEWIECVGKASQDMSFSSAGLLLVTVIGAKDVEGKHHNNPYSLVYFKGEQKKTKVIKKTRDPSWNEEFQFMLEEPPLKETIHIEVMNKRWRDIIFRSKESMGHVDINLIDVVNNGHMNDKYHLINSKKGVIHLDIRWKVI
ncbi:synaptotagmin-3-like isoform X2 [Camellia sinensis]|uniref:synaptotagmin-3-like isoform X1 n=2 Tax=Camellia sinensis TaxID=4442 RepID=UPI0010367B3B|nr:synaptotagmin-3-like isoform X1 [Camellia sinensis]XP_028098299.1 synaptotagmin-3-like isoform X2 [Camellia sinensis]